MLDFTALNNDPVKSPYSPGNDTANIKVPAELKTKPTGLEGAEYKEERRTNHVMSMLELGKLINERLARAEITIHTYNKAVRDDLPPEEVALLAAKALSLAVDEDLIYTSIEKKYRERYGIYVSRDTPYRIMKEK